MPACPSCAADNPQHARFCLECGTALLPRPAEAAESRETRRTVTIIFNDVVGSTALGERLDPEAVRDVMAHYFAAMRHVIERHGGVVEKYIGDAIMAVFGLPTIHEDDALRAVRAAAEMRDRLSHLNAEWSERLGVTIAARTGVQTGEVVAGDVATRQMLVTGDPVNTAARLEQAAQSGDILLGLSTWRLVRNHVTTSSPESFAGKGKREPMRAVRLERVGSQASMPDSGELPLLGREIELARIGEVLRRVVATGVPELATILGPAGVGKSRLVAEFVSRQGGAVRSLRGRCLPYGEGITWWPLREALEGAAAISEADSAATAVDKLRRMLEDEPDVALLVANVAGAIGLAAGVMNQQEIFWAIRRTLEHIARGGPTVLVVEDIHWAERMLLDLLEQVADTSQDVPLLILCLARPELLDAHPGWREASRDFSTVSIEGLTDEAAAALIDAIPGATGIPPEVRRRILATAEGNPLFVEEMARLLVEEGSTELPPTIQALIAARIDRLPVDERAVAQRASVVGRVFEASAVTALTPVVTRADTVARIEALVRRDLIRPEPGGLTVLDAYKFRHILIRDAAYQALAKKERARLHEAFAEWLDSAAADRASEYLEIRAYHLGQAFGYRRELGERGGALEALGMRTGAVLADAAKRARDRGDSAAAVHLYLQAEALPASSRPALAQILLDCGLALLDLARHDEAQARGQASLAIAMEVGDPRLAALARLLTLDVALGHGSLIGTDPEYLEGLELALRDAITSGDPLALALAWSGKGNHAWMSGQFSETYRLNRLALVFAREAGDTRLELDLELNNVVEAVVGPTPASEAAALAEQLVARTAAFPTVRAQALQLLAFAEAMLDRPGDGRVHSTEAIRILGDLAQSAAVANAWFDRSWVERLAGDLPAAEDALRRALTEPGALEERFFRSLAACRLAQVLVAEHKFADAAEVLTEVDAFPVPTNAPRVAGLRARIDAANGDPGAAGAVDALVGMIPEASYVLIRTDALVDAAETMATLGETDRARRYAIQAIEVAEDKENVALARQLREFVARLPE